MEGPHEVVIAKGRRSRALSHPFRSAGQTIVEFAFVFPVFVVVFFGIVEFALITASIGGFNFAARDGARLGSIVGRSDPNADSRIITDILNHVQGLVMAKPQTIYIFRANPNDSSLPNECLGTDTVSNGVITQNPYPLSDLKNCLQDQYTVNANGTTTQTVSNWPPSSRNDTEANADYLGVQVDYQYTYVTGFVGSFGSALKLSTLSVQRIEPQDFVWRTGHAPVAYAAPGSAVLGGQADVWREETAP